jgi:hypothetical protein
MSTGIYLSSKYNDSNSSKNSSRNNSRNNSRNSSPFSPSNLQPIDHPDTCSQFISKKPRNIPDTTAIKEIMLNSKTPPENIIPLNVTSICGRTVQQCNGCSSIINQAQNTYISGGLSAPY